MFSIILIAGFLTICFLVLLDYILYKAEHICLFDSFWDKIYKKEKKKKEPKLVSYWSEITIEIPEDKIKKFYTELDYVKKSNLLSAEYDFWQFILTIYPEPSSENCTIFIDTRYILKPVLHIRKKYFKEV